MIKSTFYCDKCGKEVNSINDLTASKEDGAFSLNMRLSGQWLDSLGLPDNKLILCRPCFYKFVDFINDNPEMLEVGDDT